MEKKEVDLIKNIDTRELNLNFNNKDIKDNDIIIKFNFEGLRSPYDNFESPDARKLGILLKSFTIEESK